MRLVQIQDRPLAAEDEEIYKKAYLRGSREFWERPLTFAEYRHLVESGDLVLSESSHLYADKTRDGLGVTVVPVEAVTGASITVHKRFSYPVLHNHDYVEVIYVVEGHCIHFLEDTSFEMKKGDVCILAPNAMHAISCTDETACILNLMVNRRFFDQSFLSILRGGKLLSGFLESILYERTTSPYILFPTGEDPWLRTLGQHLLTESAGKLHAYEYSVQLLIREFLLHLVREYEMLAIVPSASAHAQNDLIVAVLGYLSVNYSHATLAETAAFFGYSAPYLSRHLHENTGKTFNAIILELQMERALALLKEGQMSLTQIAHEVGCFDSSHFSKKFKNFYGRSPRSYMDALPAGQKRDADNDPQG